MNISKVLVLVAVICFVLAFLGAGFGVKDLTTLGLAFFAASFLV